MVTGTFARCQNSRHRRRVRPAVEAANGPDGPGRADRDRGIERGNERHVKTLQVTCIISSENNERSERRAFADARLFQVRLDRVHARGRYRQRAVGIRPRGLVTRECSRRARRGGRLPAC